MPDKHIVEAAPPAMIAAELEQDYFAEMDFPCTHREVLRAARANNAPGRIMDRIEKLGGGEFRSRDELLETLRAGWNTT